MERPLLDIGYIDQPMDGPGFGRLRITIRAIGFDKVDSQQALGYCRKLIPEAIWEMEERVTWGPATLAVELSVSGSCRLRCNSPDAVDLNVAIRNAYSVLSVLEVVAHGIVAPGLVPGPIGVDWWDVQRVLSTGPTGQLDVLDWPGDDTLLIPPPAVRGARGGAVLATLLSPSFSWERVKNVISVLRGQFPQPKFLIPAVPLCRGSEMKVLLLRIFAH